jgi:hypothetical protein
MSNLAYYENLDKRVFGEKEPNRRGTWQLNTKLCNLSLDWSNRNTVNYFSF